jgi:hypothetical protein
MKRNILLVLFVAVFAFAVTFVGCKQQAAEQPAADQPAAEQAAPAADQAAPAAEEAAPAK